MKRRNTKDALAETAYRLFAERGFEDVSIAEIANELEITKQALLHHFGSKEKLYGHVLGELSERFDKIVKSHSLKNLSARGQLRLILRDLYQHMIREKHDAKLIMRELLDNKPRISLKSKQTWYLRPFLETLAELIHQVAPTGSLSKSQAFARTYQIMGAVNYFAISDPTLIKMFGKQAYADAEAIFLEQLEAVYFGLQDHP